MLGDHRSCLQSRQLNMATAYCTHTQQTKKSVLHNQVNEQKPKPDHSALPGSWTRCPSRFARPPRRGALPAARGPQQTCSEKSPLRACDSSGSSWCCPSWTAQSTCWGHGRGAVKCHFPQRALSCRLGTSHKSQISQCGTYILTSGYADVGLMGPQIHYCVGNTQDTTLSIAISQGGILAKWLVYALTPSLE